MENDSDYSEVWKKRRQYNASSLINMISHCKQLLIKIFCDTCDDGIVPLALSANITPNNHRNVYILLGVTNIQPYRCINAAVKCTPAYCTLKLCVVTATPLCCCGVLQRSGLFAQHACSEREPCFWLLMYQWLKKHRHLISDEPLNCNGRHSALYMQSSELHGGSLSTCAHRNTHSCTQWQLYTIRIHQRFLKIKNKHHDH